MHPYESDVRLIMTPLNKLDETLHFEMNRLYLNDAAKHLLIEKLMNNGYKNVHPFIKKSDKMLYYAIGKNKKSYKIFYSRVINSYDSSLYTGFHQFNSILDKIHQKEIIKDLQSEGFEQMIFHTDNKPYILQSLTKDDTPNEIIQELELLNQNIELLKLEFLDV